MNSKCKTCPLWSDEGCQHNEPCPILDDASDARNVDYVSELESERAKLRAALENVSRIPIPEGHVIQQPCEACKKRVKIAREALKGAKS